MSLVRLQPQKKLRLLLLRLERPPELKFKPVVLIIYCCGTNHPKTWQLKTILIYHSQFLWVRNLNMAQLGNWRKVSHKATVKVMAGVAVISRLKWNAIFQGHSCGYQQASGLHWLFREPIPCHMSLSTKQLTTRQLASIRENK